MRADPEKPWRNNLDRQDSRDKATGEGTSRCPPSPRKGMTIRARKPPKTKENYTALAENVTELGSAEIRVKVAYGHPARGMHELQAWTDGGFWEFQVFATTGYGL